MWLNVVILNVVNVIVQFNVSLPAADEQEQDLLS